MNKLLVIIIVFYSSPLILIGQSGGTGNQYGLPKIEELVKIPNSPEAQAFTKYGNTPVNLYTGSPDISIPIHTIQGREISIPVTLTYDASGIKVEQLATAAGLGWNLNAGGMITRKVHGYPDDYLSSNPIYIPFYEPSFVSEYNFVNGFSPSEGAYYPPNNLLQYFDFMDRAIKTGIENRIEIQPDVYTLTLPGLSGTLFIDYANNTARCMEHPDVKATPIFQIYGTPQIKIITSWIIVDGTGNTYYFEVPERTTVNENNDYDGSREYYSAWGLSRIISRTKKDLVEFSWGASSWTQPKLAGRADYRIDVVNHNTVCGADQFLQPQYTSPTYFIEQLELTNIQVNGKEVLSVTGKSRLDLAGKGAIDEIKIFDQNNSQITKYKFIHSYFGPSSPPTENEIKLRLDALEIYGNTSSTNPLKYQFLYHESPNNFPSRESYAQDFWGYYNGQIYNTTLIPYNIIFDEANWTYYQWKGGKRTPNFDFAKTGTLHTIIYPTGGRTEFQYQQHRINSIVPAYENSVQKVQRGFSSISGGTTSSNTFNYCDDAYPTPPYPIGVDISFNIPANGYHDIKFLTGGTQGSGNHIQFAVLYKSQTQLDFCELYNGPSIARYYSNYPGNVNVTTTAYLESVTYRILLLNTNPNLTITMEVWGVEAVEEIGDPNGVGGLRISEIIDKDELGSITSKRLFYYGDLSTVSPGSITESFIASSNLATGTLHDYPEFETTKVRLVFEQLSWAMYTENTCYSTTRTSNSTTNATHHVSYPVVTEIQFGTGNAFNGYTVFEFHNSPESYIDGFSKQTILNGKLLKKRVYSTAGQLINQEQNYYTQRPAGNGVTAFYFRHTPQIGREDLYIKHPYNSPSQGFFHYDAKGWFNGVDQHCHLSGNISAIFYCSTIGHNAAQTEANNFAQSHPGSSITHESSPPGTYPQLEWYRVTAPNHVILNCEHFDGEWQKMPYLLPRYWATTDSTRVHQYTNGGYLETVTKNFYDNTNHYQITRTEFKDSKGINRKVELSYPHELQTAEPSNPAWQALVNANRIAERIQIKSTFASNQPDFLQKTEYKSITVDGNTVYVPDVTKLSSGAGPLEPRIQIHQYDNAGNITEISKESDMRTAYRWGYNQTFPIAVVQNALASEIFHTSFEAGEENGNSADNDSRTGIKSKTGGYSKLLTGLTPSKSYMLTYWRKSSGVWSYQSTTVNLNSSTTTYSISLTGQVDEIRFYPVGALMTTYTYTPGLGITSVTDQNNQTTYYEYDAMGRLWLVKDHNKKIIKEHKYNYRNNQ